ncbi:beta-taxilin isoform X2 [Cimex lectularius]|nr:beta-taxilin isoform X2 [Cimex lectularius]XP_014249058.1 beta-taxilin isoform X2 [Cimex lectularius]XP_014249059.1 beta-taxilin isoform X2 [Cimex lectularius]
MSKQVGDDQANETTLKAEKPQDIKLQEKPTKRSREEKMRKKDEKSAEYMLKTLNNLSTPEEKLGVMYQKYAEVINDHRMLQNTIKALEKKLNILQKEKEQLQTEHNKAILTRSRLENLCRELQRQNKAIKDESINAMKEEEEKKREVAAMFHSTLTELGNLVSKNNDKNNKLRDDNLDMSTKLKNVCEQYEKKEQHVDKLAKQLELEMQLTEVKLAKAQMEMAIEKDTLNREKQQLLLELAQCRAINEEHQNTEQGLRNQIQMYNDKYDEFHKALIQSNEAISGFKQEMERMAKQISKLEKETMSWRTRYESTHTALLKMTDEKLSSDQNACITLRKLTALQGLCRKLQEQCTFLRDELKKKGFNPDELEKNQTQANSDKKLVNDEEKPLEHDKKNLVEDESKPMNASPSQETDLSVKELKSEGAERNDDSSLNNAVILATEVLSGEAVLDSPSSQPKTPQNETSPVTEHSLANDKDSARSDQAGEEELQKSQEHLESSADEEVKRGETKVEDQTQQKKKNKIKRKSKK